jgi:hypothetical protein
MGIADERPSRLQDSFSSHSNPYKPRIILSQPKTEEPCENGLMKYSPPAPLLSQHHPKKGSRFTGRSVY